MYKFNKTLERPIHTGKNRQRTYELPYICWTVHHAGRTPLARRVHELVPKFEIIYFYSYKTFQIYFMVVLKCYCWHEFGYWAGGS